MTQNAAILSLLRARPGGITARDALDLVGSMRLAARINDLRSMGYWVDSQMVEVPSRAGKARVAKYRLIGGRDEVAS